MRREHEVWWAVHETITNFLGLRGYGCVYTPLVRFVSIYLMRIYNETR